MLDFVMVVPTLNEEGYIGEMLKSADRKLSGMFRSYRIVVVDESSRDATTKIVEQFMEKHKSVALISGRHPGNRGLDVKYGMSRYESRAYFFIDADLEPSLPYLDNAMRHFRRGCDVVTGSKYANERIAKRPPLRTMVSKSYNLLINIIFNDRIMDHQCGFKLFSRRAFKIINRVSRERHWVWDTETLLIARYNGLKVCEIPILMKERKWSERTPLKRLIKDMTEFTIGIAKLFYRFRILKEYS
ncbi:MAG: glycosyltransferase [Candidatus Micrarchaeota archaeon]|nr:glycosyltransferase [Candidatus Micrarchaeota archaeon]